MRKSFFAAAVFCAMLGAAQLLYCQTTNKPNPSARLGRDCREGSTMTLDGLPIICRAGNWGIDQERLAERHRIQREKSALVWAARTRVLSDAEMQKVRDMGVRLLVTDYQPFMKADLDREFNELLLLQFQIRSISVSKGCGK